jgi:hypothetical protein
LSEIEDCQVAASDGSMGTVKDVHFDDGAWVIRYLIVEMGTWLPGRKVLLSPLSIGRIDHVRHHLAVSLTRDQIKNGPGIDTDKPVSRQHEIRYLEHYGHPYYWDGSGTRGEGAYLGMHAGAADRGSNARIEADAARQRSQDDDPHLRSCREVTQYHVHASDGEVGGVNGFLIDEHGWVIRYLIVNTSRWWLGHQVLIAPEWIGEVSWPHQTVTTSLTRQQIRLAPTYQPGVPLGRDLEAGLYAHYGEVGYWAPAAERVKPD